MPRSLRTSFIDEWQGRRDEVAAAAAQLAADIGTAVREEKMFGYVPFTGQSAGAIREILPAAEIIRRLVAEAEQALEEATRLVT